MAEYPTLSMKNRQAVTVNFYYRYIYGKADKFYPHRHDFFELFLTVTEGVRHKVNGVEQNLPSGALVFIRPNDLHGFMYEDEVSKKSEYINLLFTEDIARSLFDYLGDDFPTEKLLNSKMPPMVILNNTEKKKLISRLQMLNTVGVNVEQDLRLQIKSILASVFIQYFNKTSQISKDEVPLWFTVLLNAMNKPENFTVGISRMIELSEKSREHLSRVTKKYIGVSLTQYINNLRINYTANLILNSNMPIIDICYAGGFQNVGYFYKVFKQEFGMPPAQFAAEHKKTV